VAVVRFSRQAEADLLAIGTYTLEMWGQDQATRYLDDLEACCVRLARDPGLGRACDDIRPDLQRFQQGRHVIFYRRDSDGILISRILHQRMLPERHIGDALDDTP
jgi:toxin ParE1/3/4